MSAPDAQAPGGRRRVLIICRLDAFANGIKPREIERFLKERGHFVKVVNTYFLSETRSLAGLALFAIHAAWSLVMRHSELARRFLSYYLFRADHELRGRILRATLSLDDFDLVICETDADARVLAVPTSARTFLDSPAPFADEMFYEGRLTARQWRKLRARESAIFESVDYLAFHWETYARYVVDRYGISGRNLITFNFGCNPEEVRAEFRYPPRIVYLGALDHKFVNTPLLARLAALYADIDVYGGPPPDPSLGLNYLGYAPSLDVLREYQLGLVTCSMDPLRQEGFSSKHLQYLAYGLPALVPVWRRHLDLLRGSVAYDEDTFVSTVERLSREDEWRRLSDEAYEQAIRLRWDDMLKPLESLLRDERSSPPAVRLSSSPAG